MLGSGLHTGELQAAEERYRVEVLLLTHLNSDAEAREFQILDDYSSAVDFLQPAEEEESSEDLTDDGNGDLAEALPPVPPAWDADRACYEQPGFSERRDAWLEDRQLEYEEALAELEAAALAAEIALNAAATGPTSIDDPLAETGSDAETGLSDASGEEDTPIEEEPLPRLIHHAEMTETLRESWRRLRLSAPFRPEQYLSWEQASDEPFPVLRLHDMQVILSDDPYLDEKRSLARQEAIDEARKLAETERRRLAGEPEHTAEELAILCAPPGTLPEPDPEREWPAPTEYYRLDGTVSLRRSRFLHFDVRVDMREELWESQELIAPTGDMMTDSFGNPVTVDNATQDSQLLPDSPPANEQPPYIIDDEISGQVLYLDPAAWFLQPLEPTPPAYNVHRLDQSRQVKTGRMEYFDHPKLGVLLYISKIEVPDPD